MKIEEIKKRIIDAGSTYEFGNVWVSMWSLRKFNAQGKSHLDVDMGVLASHIGVKYDTIKKAVNELYAEEPARKKAHENEKKEREEFQQAFRDSGKGWR